MGRRTCSLIVSDQTTVEPSVSQKSFSLEAFELYPDSNPTTIPLYIYQIHWQNISHSIHNFAMVILHLSAM